MRYALLLLAVLMRAQSQPTSPAPAKSGQEKQESATSKDTKADEHKATSPVAVTTIVNAPVAQDPAKNKEEPSSADWWMRIFTGVIASATIAQAYIYWRQKQLMRDALSETKKSADAAKQSADALINSERAWVVIDADPRFHPVPGGTDVQFWIWNTGKTPAKLTFTRSDAHVLPAGTPFPDTPPYSPGNNGTPYKHILAPGKPDFASPVGITGCLGFGIPLARFNLPPIQNGNDSFYMFGRVEYETFGIPQYTTFGFYWKPPSLQNPSPIWDRQKLPQSYNENT